MGHYTADVPLWSAIVTILATLDFNLATNADGNEMRFKLTFMNEVIDYDWIVPVLFNTFSKRFQLSKSIPLSARPLYTHQQKHAWSVEHCDTAGMVLGVGMGVNLPHHTLHPPNPWLNIMV